MSVGKQYLPWLVCAAIFAVGVPALASGEERAPAPVDAAMTVHDNYFQDAATSGSDDHTVSITTGGRVTFTYADDGTSGASHNVAFRDGPDPSSCVQTAGTDIDPDTVPPLPDGPKGPPWAGYCTFDAPGTYSFYCQVHGGMEGTIEVTGTATATPTQTATATVTTTATATATPTPPAAAARIDAHDTTGPTRNWFQERGSSDTDNSVTIKPGERVAFAYPAGNNFHDVEFRTGPAPASCPQTKAAPGFGLDANDAPPMPAFVNPPGWEGYCTFTNPGTYTFVCGAHGEMTGTVIVQADATPTATATATATATQTATAIPTTSPTPTPTATPKPAAPKIATASFKRSKRTVTVSGTTSATGKVTVKLAYKVGKKARTKRLSLPIKSGKFTGTLKLSAADAKKASKLSVTVTAAGSTAKKTVSVRR